MNFDEYDPPAIGTRFDVGDMCIEYTGEYFLSYVEPSTDAESDFELLDSLTDAPLDLLLSDFGRIGGYAELKRDYHGIWLGTIDSGYLLRLSDDGEGAFLFHHWSA